MGLISSIGLTDLSALLIAHGCRTPDQGRCRCFNDLVSLRLRQGFLAPERSGQFEHLRVIVGLLINPKHQTHGM